MPVEHIWGIRSTDGVDNNFHSGVEVYGEPTLVNNLFIGGKVFGDAVVTSSMIGGNSVISGTVHVVESTLMGNCVVSDKAWVLKSCISDEALVTDRASVKNSILMGDAKVFGEAHVENAIIGAGVIVKGTARIVGPTRGLTVFEGYMTLDRGEWSRPPISFTTSTGLVVTESADNLVKVNCTTNTVEKLLSPACDRYGSLLGMTQEEVDEVKYYVELIDKERRKQ